MTMMPAPGATMIDLFGGAGQMPAIIHMAPHSNGSMHLPGTMTMTIHTPIVDELTLNRYNNKNGSSSSSLAGAPSLPLRDAGQHYYSSPWKQARAPLVSPARLHQLARVQSKRAPSLAPLRVTSKVPPAPVSKARENEMLGAHQAPLNTSEMEELVAVGPPQMMPFYQTSNGQLLMSPPADVDSEGRHAPHQRPQHSSQHQQQLLDSVSQADDEVTVTGSGQGMPHSPAPPLPQVPAQGLRSPQMTQRVRKNTRNLASGGYRR